MPGGRYFHIKTNATTGMYTMVATKKATPPKKRHLRYSICKQCTDVPAIFTTHPTHFGAKLQANKYGM